MRLRRTRPYRPQTNGKAEASVKILQAEWAYRRLYAPNEERLNALPVFLREYNHDRPQGGIGGPSPPPACKQRLWYLQPRSGVSMTRRITSLPECSFG